MNFGVCFVVCLFGRRGVVLSSVISEKKKIAVLFKMNVYLPLCVEGVLGVFNPLIFVSRVLGTKIIYCALALTCKK